MAYSDNLINTRDGYEKDGVFYSSDLTSIPNTQLSAKGGGFSKIAEGSFGVKLWKTETGYDSVADFSKIDLEVTIKIWDEQSDSAVITDFIGRAYLGAKGRGEYTFKLKSKLGELAGDLLSIAPDIKLNALEDAFKSKYFDETYAGDANNEANTYLDNRVFPMRLGIIKYATMFKLSENEPTTTTGDSVGEYYTDGTVYATKDNGLGVQFEQFAIEYRVLKNKARTKPVYEYTMDIDGFDNAVKSDAISPDVVTIDSTFTQDVAPTESDTVLKDGMIWVDTSNEVNVTYVWATAQWVEANVSLIESTDFVDIATGTGFRLKANALATSADPTVFGAFIKGATLEGSDVNFSGIFAISEDGTKTSVVFNTNSYIYKYPEVSTLISNPSEWTALRFPIRNIWGWDYGTFNPLATTHLITDSGGKTKAEISTAFSSEHPIGYFGERFYKVATNITTPTASFKVSIRYLGTIKATQTFTMYTSATLSAVSNMLTSYGEWGVLCYDGDIYFSESMTLIMFGVGNSNMTDDRYEIIIETLAGTDTIRGYSMSIRVDNFIDSVIHG